MSSDFHVSQNLLAENHKIDQLNQNMCFSMCGIWSHSILKKQTKIILIIELFRKKWGERDFSSLKWTFGGGGKMKCDENMVQYFAI